MTTAAILSPGKKINRLTFDMADPPLDSTATTLFASLK
jgi:hypothetical protein